MKRLLAPPRYGKTRIDMRGAQTLRNPNRIGLGRLVGPENPDGRLAQDIGARPRRRR